MRCDLIVAFLDSISAYGIGSANRLLRVKHFFKNFLDEEDI